MICADYTWALNVTELSDHIREFLREFVRYTVQGFAQEMTLPLQEVKFVKPQTRITTISVKSGSGTELLIARLDKYL